MKDKITLNLIRQSKRVGKIDLLLENLAYNKCCISLLSSVDGCKNKYENLDFFCALTDFRMDLEKKDLYLACYGCLDGVYPSGMSADMTNGTVAYDFSTPEKIAKREKVNIFDPVDESKYQFLVAAEKQKKTREDYFQSKKDKWLQENK